MNLNILRYNKIIVAGLIIWMSNFPMLVAQTSDQGEEISISPLVSTKYLKRGYTHRISTNNFVVVHYDNNTTTNIISTIRILKKRRLSYHYLIDRNGHIYKLVDPKYQARHAGKSLWNGISHWNRHSIGISMRSGPHDEYTYTDNQYESLKWLLTILKKRYPDLTNERILGHSEVAYPVGRKQDPGQKFEWSRILVLGWAILYNKESTSNLKPSIYPAISPLYGFIPLEIRN